MLLEFTFELWIFGREGVSCELANDDEGMLDADVFNIRKTSAQLRNCLMFGFRPIVILCTHTHKHARGH